jgi:uncharacterized protein (TIGR03643 family)
MAWEDRTTFDAILLQFGLKEQEVIDLMRNEMKPKSFIMWRKRVQGRKTKHENYEVLKKVGSNVRCKDRSITKFQNVRLEQNNKNFAEIII